MPPPNSLLEALKNLQAGQGNLGAPASPLTAPSAPSAPTVGPTLANAPFNPKQFFGGRAPDQDVGLADVGAAGQIRQPEQAPNALLDLAEREGALGPRLTDIFSGGATAISEGGTPPPVIPPIQPNALGGVPAGPAPSAIPPSPTAQIAPLTPSITAPQVDQGVLQAGQGQGLTTVGGTPIAPFLSGEAIPEAGLVAERPLGGRGDSGAAGEAALQAAGELAGTRARPGGTFAEPRRGEARGPDSTGRAAGELSMADAVDLAGGDRTKARALVVQSRQGEGGKPLTFDQQIKLRNLNISEGRFEFDKSKEFQEQADSQLENIGKAKTAEAKAAASGKAFVNSVSDISETMGRMVGRSDEFFGSGLVGKAGSFVPGTTGHSQMSDAEFIQSNAALNSMAELKRLSPTGSTGFGALSQKELEVLQNQFANLNPFVDPNLFRKNMGQLKNRFDSMIDTARETHAVEFGQEAADAIYGKAGASASTESTQAPESQKLTSPSTGGTFTVVQRP